MLFSGSIADLRDLIQFGKVRGNCISLCVYEHVLCVLTLSFPPQDEKCKFNASSVGADDTGYVDVKHGDEDALKVAVATVGPISVAIDAGHASFQFYKEGVYNEPSCSSTELDHGVLAVGYGTTVDGKDYWLVKNR